MTLSPANPRLPAGTRGQILALLRRTERTVSELRKPDPTENGVRMQLAILERDGLIERHGVRRSGRKPAHIYRPTMEAERLFPKAHEATLQHLLDVLGEEVSPARRDVAAQAGASGSRAAKTEGRSAGATQSRLIYAWRDGRSQRGRRKRRRLLCLWLQLPPGSVGPQLAPVVQGY